MALDREKLAADLFVALIANPERYKYIAEKINNGELTNESATAKNIHKAYMLADQFIEASKTTSSSK